MADVIAFGQQFVTTYYQTFDSNRAGLAALYVSLLAAVTQDTHTLENVQVHMIRLQVFASHRDSVEPRLSRNHYHREL